LPKTRPLQFAFLVAACTIAAASQVIVGKTMSTASPDEAVEVDASSGSSSNFVTSALLLPKEETSSSTLEKEQARLEAAFDALEQQARTDALVERPARTDDSIQDQSLDPTPRKQNFLYLAYYAFSEIPPDEKPADTILETMKDLPIGTPVEEIRRASDAFGLDFNFMKAVAKIESGFNPKQRTGSYIGLFQLSNYEFQQYGSGNITDPRDNSIAGAYKFAAEALLFEFGTGRKPTFSDLYLIHQQGWQGAAQHVSHPKRIAWKSMCATDEGKEKGERWCKLAIWRNTLPAIKHVWKSVDKLTSGAFVGMWQQRVDNLYSHYSVAITKN
jgi:transglycosylase-like protein with SLT domain